MPEPVYDLIDENDNPLNKTATYEQVHNKGLWVRGIHVIIYTPEKEIVMQKRSPSLKYHPNEIEISVGGGVDAGESPEEAAAREMKEELGLKVQPGDLTFISKSKFNHRTKTQINRWFIYSYSLCLPKDKLKLHINPEETTLAFFISKARLKRALTRHRIKNLGKISSQYSYWEYLLDSI